MVTKLEQLKEWAKQNVTLIDLLPNNNGLEVTTRLIDVLEDEVDEKYYLSEEKAEKLVMNIDSDKVIGVREATKQGYAIAEQGDRVNYTYPTSKTRRGRVGKQVAQTLQAGEVNQGVVINPLKGKTEYGWHFEQAVYDPQGITRTVKANGGSGNIPKTIENVNQGVVIDDTQGYDGTRIYDGISPTLRSRRSGLKTIVTPKEESGEVDQGVVMDNALNFYAKDNVVYDEEQYKKLVKDNNDFEVDYIYVEPTLYKLDEKHILLINNDQNQFEVI